jgi:hypothetical protein
MMVLEIKLDGKDINTNREELNHWIIPALTTFSEALRLAASQELDIDFSDLKSGYRMRFSNNTIYAEIYLYDSLSSGAGYSNRVADLIENVIDRTFELLDNCDCESSCPKCVRHFWNQNLHKKLDRKAALQLIKWIKTKELYISKEEEQKQYLRVLDKIIKLNCGEGNGINYDSKTLHINGIQKTFKIYPAMQNPNTLRDSKNTILIPDMLLKKGIPEVWKRIKRELNILY